MLVFILRTVAALSCLEVQCQLPTTEYECVISSDLVKLTQCSSSQYCPLDSLDDYLSNSTSEPVDCEISNSSSDCPKDQYTGHYCCKSADCTLGKCEENRCAGYDTGEQCTDDSDCTSEHYCKPNAGNDFGICTKSLQKGDDCDFDNECASGLGCSRGSCVGLFSLSSGKPSDQNYFCKTQLRNKQNECDSLEVYINNEKILDPFKCQIGDTCTYKYRGSGEQYDEESCMCDGTLSGEGYCGHYVKYDLDHSNDLASAMSYTSSLCSGDDASSSDLNTLYDCQSLSLSDYYKASNITAIFNNWALYQSKVISSCSKEIGLFDPDFKFSASKIMEFSILFIAYIISS